MFFRRSFELFSFLLSRSCPLRTFRHPSATTQELLYLMIENGLYSIYPAIKILISAPIHPIFYNENDIFSVKAGMNLRFYSEYIITYTYFVKVPIRKFPNAQA